jgi:hypothetical protein
VNGDAGGFVDAQGPAPSPAAIPAPADPTPGPAQPAARRPGGWPRRWRPAAALALALAAYALAAGLYLRPIWQVLGTQVTPELIDPVFNLYILKWVAHESHRGFAGFWDPPFFYPARGVLAYSDHLLGPGLAAAAFTSLLPRETPRWVTAYNLLLWSSFALTGLAACWVLRRGGLGWAAAWMGGAMFAFSPFRWEQLSHLQVLLMALIPPTLWSFDRLLERPGWRRAAVFLACYLLHLSGGCYLAYMIHVPLAVLLANRLPHLAAGGRWRAALPALGATFLVAAVAAGALFGKYWSVARTAGLHWGPGPARHWGASLLSYLTPSQSNLYSGLLPAGLHRPEGSLFPGWLATGLAIAGARDLWRRRRAAAPAPAPRLTAGRRLALGGLLALAAVGWLAGEARTWTLPVPGAYHLVGLPRWATRTYPLALLLVAAGVLGWLALRRRWRGGRPPRAGGLEPRPRGLLLAGAATAALSFPIFFDPLARLVPGLGDMRVPARFDAFTSLAIVWLAASALDRRLHRWTDPRRAPASRRRGFALAAATAALLLVEVCPRPFGWADLDDEDDFPDVYSWIASQPDVHALLELPLADPVLPSPYLVDISYMYYGTLHWKPLVNGYSAHAPSAIGRLRQRCCQPVPDAETLAMLREWGVTHLVVHRHELPLRQRQQLDRWEASGQADRLVIAGGGVRVYRIRAAGAGG